METYEFERYSTNVEGLRDTLNRYGVAIIPNVLNENECRQMLDGLWNFFEHITIGWGKPILRNDEESWKQIYNLFPLHSMLFQYWNCGHSQVCWDIRQNPNIVDIFARFWDCQPENLLVSFDGFSFNMPPENTGRGWNRNNGWLHTDQSYTRNNFECVQSWVTALDVEDGDATLVFLEGSHLFHGEFARRFGVVDKSDWFRLNEVQTQYYLHNGCAEKRIRCPAGSMVFWDSRTIHSGSEALRERLNPKLRAVIYVCYEPRGNCTKSKLQKKISAFESLRTTSHWPCKAKLFPKTPRTYGKPLPTINNIDAPILTPLGRRLVGYNV